MTYRNESDLRMIFMLSSSLSESTSLDDPGAAWLWLWPLLFFIAAADAVFLRHRRIRCRVLAKCAAFAVTAVDSVSDVMLLRFPTDQNRRSFGILLQMVIVAVGCSGQ